MAQNNHLKRSTVPQASDTNSWDSATTTGKCRVCGGPTNCHFDIDPEGNWYDDGELCQDDDCDGPDKLGDDDENS